MTKDMVQLIRILATFAEMVGSVVSPVSGGS